MLNDTNEEFGSRGLVDVRMGVSGHWQGRACPPGPRISFLPFKRQNTQAEPAGKQKIAVGPLLEKLLATPLLVRYKLASYGFLQIAGGFLRMRIMHAVC